MESMPMQVAMWVAMMAAMMLPSLVPMLRRYRQAVAATAAARLNGLTALAALAYFLVWTAFGVAAFALAPALPLAGGVVILLAGLLQFTRWKAHHLACCRAAPGSGTLPADAATAWRHGLRLGLHCCQCCFGLMAILLVLGVMDLRAMALVTAAITLERLAPAGARYARLTGAVASAAGLFLMTGVN
jgi:predicted metal-binding membrane protein